MSVRRICCLNNLGMERSSYGTKMTLLSLGNIILLKEKGGMRESNPRQVEKNSRAPEEEKVIWNSQGGLKDKCFFLHSLVRII